MHVCFIVLTNLFTSLLKIMWPQVILTVGVCHAKSRSRAEWNRPRVPYKGNRYFILHLADAFVQSILQLFIHSYSDGGGCRARCRHKMLALPPSSSHPSTLSLTQRHISLCDQKHTSVGMWNTFHTVVVTPWLFFFKCTLILKCSLLCFWG